MEVLNNFLVELWVELVREHFVQTGQFEQVLSAWHGEPFFPTGNNRSAVVMQFFSDVILSKTHQPAIFAQQVVDLFSSTLHILTIE